MTQRDLARAIGVSPSTVGMYEIRERIPPLKTAMQIAKLFNIKIDDILFF